MRQVLLSIVLDVFLETTILLLQDIITRTRKALIKYRQLYRK